MRKIFVVLSLLLLLSLAAFSQLPPGIPRNETLILDQIFRYSIPHNFNVWTPVGITPTRQAFVFDTLWYIDQHTGEWINSLAAEPPKYNDDFTQMIVKLREGIYWSDGVEFTADDLIFTVEYLKAHEGLVWNADFNAYVDKVEKLDKYTVKFTLKEPYPRFHNLFTARYNACYIMPKHVWEKVEDPGSFDFFPPVSLGAYVYKDSDPSGYWELFERREDWQRTSVGVITGKPGPKYILTIFYGPSEKKVMAMLSNELDVLMDLDLEAFKALIRRGKYVRSWYKDFPWAYPDEIDMRNLSFNLEKYPFNIKDVRWALALALNIIELEENYVGGISRVNPIPHPATTYHMKYFHIPLKPWLEQLEIEVTPGEKFKPFDSNIPFELAKWARKQGYKVPDDPDKVIEMFGIGWWKYAPDVATKLLEKHGFKKENGKWLLPDGTPWKFSIIVAPDEEDAFRQTMWAVDQWKKFGIDVSMITLERNPFYAKNQTGDFECTTAWGVGGSPSASLDKWPYINGYHSRFYKPTGETQTLQNIIRLKDPEVDRIIDEMGAISPDDPKSYELTKDWIKLWTENMWTIVLTSFKKMITYNEYYWTNYPTAENPYGQPLYWFMGSRFVIPHFEKTGRK
ncbi:MAG: peptide/nickel transport system substrate-binding protein [Thermotogaceae bacterium]|nr:peptide/nickel transport system substrate-binding protein [Thermotogaceae bacterium]